MSYDCTRSHHIYQQANSKDFVHSSILSAMNNVQHSRVNNRNIYLPRARVSGSWPAILDAFLASRSRDHHNRKKSFSLSRQPHLHLLTSQSGKDRSCSNRQTDRGTSTCFSLFFSFVFSFSLIMVIIITLNNQEKNLTMDLARFFFGLQFCLFRDPLFGGVCRCMCSLTILVALVTSLIFEIVLIRFNSLWFKGSRLQYRHKNCTLI